MNRYFISPIKHFVSNSGFSSEVYRVTVTSLAVVWHKHGYLD